MFHFLNPYKSPKYNCICIATQENLSVEWSIKKMQKNNLFDAGYLFR